VEHKGEKKLKVILAVRDIPRVGCNLRSFLAYFREICGSTLHEGVFAVRGL